MDPAQQEQQHQEVANPNRQDYVQNQGPLIPPGRVMRRRSTLVVPKELLWPLCQRLFLVLFVMCSTALGIRLHALWRLGKLGSLSRMDNHIHVNGTHFFLDIGSGNAGLPGFSHTKQLEDNGWRGVCADPFPDKSRSCQTLAMPVTPVRGDNVKMMDCRDPTSHTLPGKCTQVNRNGVTVVDVLKLTRAPKVIDYINLDTEGTELAVLKTFPSRTSAFALGQLSIATRALCRPARWMCSNRAVAKSQTRAPATGPGAPANSSRRVG